MSLDEDEVKPRGREDNFGNLVANPLTDILDVPGHYQFTPERKRVYRNGNRVWLMYGDDSGFVNTNWGTELRPASGETLTFNSTNPGGYQLGRTDVNQDRKVGRLSSSGKERRAIPDTDYTLVLAKASEVGTYEIVVTTEQNS